MVKMRISAPTILLAVFVACAASLVAGPEPIKKGKKLPNRKIQNDRIEWLTYDKGLSYSKSEKKHLFVDFTTKWCGWCKKMDQTTFADSTVIHAVNAGFVPVKVWADSDSLLDIEGYQITQKDLAKNEFKVGGYPAFWFVSPEGQRIGPLPGYRGSADMLRVFEFIRERRYDTTKAGGNEKAGETGKDETGPKSKETQKP